MAFETELDKETARLADAIMDELTRLGCSAVTDPYSGLMVNPVNNLVTEIPLVRISDDLASGMYDARRVLEILRAAHDASLDSDETANVWQLIYDCEA